MTEQIKSRLQAHGYLPFDQVELISKIDSIDISMQGQTVVTKYFGRVISVTPVSNQYEIFDIRGFLKSKLNQILDNFKISFYRLRLVRGIQELNLISDEVDINGVSHFKSFFILNSSDKSRRLNFNMGLYRADNSTYFIGMVRNMFLSKKHLRGISQLAEEAFQAIDHETFDEQIAAIKSLINQKIHLSNLRQIIVDKDQKVNHMKFDALKNQIRFDRSSRFTESQIKTLLTPSQNLIINSENDFQIDAFKVFNLYLQIFSRQDSYIVKKETERIFKITTCFIRDERLSQILDLI